MPLRKRLQRGRIVVPCYLILQNMPKNSPNPNQVGSAAVMAGAVVVLLFVGVFNSVFIIEPGEVGIVIRLGEAQPNPLDEGIHFVIPFITKVERLNIRIQKAEVRTEAASQDMQVVAAAIVVNYRVDRAQAVELFRRLGRHYLTTVIEPAIQEAFKSDAAKYVAEELITKRAQVSTEFQQSVGTRLEQFDVGLVIAAVNITSFEFSAEFNQEIEQKVMAEQRAGRAERELVRFEFEAKQKVVTAEGEAKAILEKAKAEAESLGLKQRYATMELIWLTAVEKWDGKLPTHLFGASPVPVFETGK